MVMLQNVCENLRTDFGRSEAPSTPFVRYLVKKGKEPGIIIDKPKLEKPMRFHFAMWTCKNCVRSTISSVCSLSCEKSERNCHR